MYSLFCIYLRRLYLKSPLQDTGGKSEDMIDVNK